MSGERLLIQPRAATCAHLPRVRQYDPGPAWEIRFWSIFCGQALSLMGSALVQFVLLWWITDTTGTISAAATAGTAALLPQALLAPIGGTFADRYSRRALMIVADSISAVSMIVLIALFVSQRIEPLHVYIVVFVRSAAQAFQAPAAAASMAMLVPTAYLPRAAGLSHMLQGFITVAAPALGAFAMSVASIRTALSIDVITAVIGIIPLLIFRVPQVHSPLSRRTTLLSDLRHGLRVVWTHPGLRRLYALLGAVMLSITPAALLAPLLVKQHFSGGITEVAWMEGLSGVGMVVGGLLITAFAPRRQIPWVLGGLATSCFAVALTALGPADTFRLAVMWWIVSGVTVVMGTAPLTALLQITIPNYLQGRLLSLLSTVMALAAPIGLLLAMPAGELIGVRWLFVVLGLLGGFVSLAGFMSPALLGLQAYAEEEAGSAEVDDGDT